MLDSSQQTNSQKKHKTIDGRAAWPPVFTAIAMPIEINNDLSTIEKTIG